MKPHRGLRRLLARRLDREVASGLLLTLALGVTLVGGLVLGVLALVVRRVAFIQHVDNSVAAWGYDHRSGAATSGLHAITDLGSIRIVVVLAVLVALVDLWRNRTGWALLFLLVVLVGMELAQLGVKDLVGRAPPDPRSRGGGARAVVSERPLGDRRGVLRRGRAGHRAQRCHGRRDRSSSPQPSAIAVAVAASRVLLDLHWLSDVVGGLALGWAWFALCAVVFGGLAPRADRGGRRRGGRGGSDFGGRPTGVTFVLAEDRSCVLAGVRRRTAQRSVLTARRAAGRRRCRRSRR